MLSQAQIHASRDKTIFQKKGETCFQLFQNKQSTCVVGLQKTKFSYLVHQRKMEVVMIFFFTEKSWIPWQNTSFPKAIREQTTTYQRSKTDSFLFPARYRLELIAHCLLFSAEIFVGREAQRLSHDELLSWRQVWYRRSACSLY